MTVTDKDAKELQKMFEKLEKQSKKDKNKENEASIGSFFKSCLSADEKKKLDKPKNKWYSSGMNKFKTLLPTVFGFLGSINLFIYFLPIL